MGIIKRQGLKGSIVSYFGVLIGIASTLWIYPSFLELYGQAQLIISTATLFIPIASFGIPSLAVRFFQDFKDQENKHNNFIGVLIFSIILFNLLFFTLSFFCGEYLLHFLDSLEFNTEQINKHIIIIFSLTFLLGLNTTLIQYTSNFQRIVVPNLLNTLTIKIGIPVLLLLTNVISLQFSDETIVLYGLIALYSFITLTLLGYLILLNQFKISLKLPKISKPLRKQIIEFTTFGIFTTLSSLIAFKLDTIMIPSLTEDVDYGNRLNGIYSVSMFLTNIILIPYTSIKNIMTPMLSNLIKAKNYPEIKKLYQKGTNNLLIISILTVLLIVSNTDSIFRLTSDYESIKIGIHCVFFLGLAKVIEASSGLSGQLILMSEYFKVNSIAIAVLGISNLTLNYFLIPKYSINGAAFATFISILGYNSFRMIYVYYRFKITTLSFNTLKILVVTLITIGVIYFLPKFENLFINLTLKSSVIILIFIPLIFFTKSSEEFNDFVVKKMKALKL